MDLTKCTAYEVLEKRTIDDLKSEGVILRHKKTGARVVLVSNDDNNKVFYIGFRTPPTDSTGVAHIIEHTVLCGSKKFPVKDPFIELAKGSLNTFLNAMTYPDKTVYPVASCNDQDLQNLMDVYLDAVFHPNIYNERMIFEQEGWHYECEGENEPVTINGVVYNEMKGAFSSPDDVLDREVLNSLYPGKPYGVESGGDPECIPNLTYEDYLEFHRKYYHPSNSYIYLYGDMDMVEKLKWIDEAYLSKYDALFVDSEIGEMRQFDAPVYLTKEYSISESESEEKHTYLTYNASVGTSLDKENYIAFQVLDYVIGSAPGAPVKKALIDAGIGDDVYSLYDNGIKYPYFSFVAKNADASDENAFVDTIEETLKKLVKEGLCKESILAAINLYEFKYKEADFGSYPKGLMYGLQALDSWLYDDMSPFMHIEANATFASLREKAKGRYFEELIEQYLLNNNHKIVLKVVPKKGLTKEKDDALKERLAAFKKSLSKDELQKIIAHTKELHAYQESEDAPEALATIPLLRREDMKKEAEPFINEELSVGDMPVLYHDIYTNGVGYVKILFFLDQFKQEYLPYLSILKAVLGYVDTDNYTYGQLFDAINLKSGGIRTGVSSYENSKKTGEYRLTFEAQVKCFENQLPEAFELLKEVLLLSHLDEKKRVREIISEIKSKLQGTLMSAGHSIAAVRTLAHVSETAALQEQLSGVAFYRMIERIDRAYDEEYPKMIEALKYAISNVLSPNNMMLDYTGSREGLTQIMKLCDAFRGELQESEKGKETLEVALLEGNEAFSSASQVQYVCRGGNFIQKGLPYTGALRVLRVMMGYEYLWINVRVKGGAYGCMSRFGKNGDCYFVSYRDPNLTKTIETYEGAAEFVRAYEADERTMTQYIIGAISEKDTPLSPKDRGARSLSAYLTNFTFADEQKERDELLMADAQTIRGLSKYIDAFLEDGILCVVGNEDVIAGEKELFDHVESLFTE